MGFFLCHPYACKECKKEGGRPPKVAALPIVMLSFSKQAYSALLMKGYL